MFGRYDVLKRILKLDPKDDCQEIVYLVGSYESPWLIQKALEFALFRTYAVPHTSRILRATGQFQTHGQKRYDDTSLMLAGIAEHGYDSPFAQTVIARMNDLHGRYNLRNVDMLYVLSTFVFEPLRWSEQYGWRTPTYHEQLANYYFWVEVGKRMGIKDIPDTMEKFKAFNEAHEAHYFRYDEANQVIGEATIQIFLSWYPAWMRPLLRQIITSFMEDRLLYAFGFEKPHGTIRWLAQTGLKFGYGLLRFFPPRKTPFHFTEVPTRSYPDGFEPEELGARDPVTIENPEAVMGID
jgi:hypothetical protein